MPEKQPRLRAPPLQLHLAYNEAHSIETILRWDFTLRFIQLTWDRFGVGPGFDIKIPNSESYSTPVKTQSSPQHRLLVTPILFV